MYIRRTFNDPLLNEFKAMCRMVGVRRHTMSSVDVTTFVIYSLILCAVAQWNLKPTEAPKIEGGALCVQMDFTRTFQTNTKWYNMNHV